MNSIIVLNEFEAVVGHTWGFNFLGFALICLGLVLMCNEFLVLIRARKRLKKALEADSKMPVEPAKPIKPFSICAIVIAFCIVFTGFSQFIDAKEVTETQYEIFMPGKVDMIEFTELYEITGQHGLIYTVRENQNEFILKGER